MAGSFEHGNELFGIQRRWEISWLVEWLLVSQEGLCSMEWVS
jgi:hypothetical protein